MSNLQLAVITDEISNDLVFAGASVGSGVVQLYHQLQKDNSRTKKYRGFFSSAATIYREEGIYAFFKGYCMIYIYFLKLNYLLKLVFDQLPDF